MASKLTPVGSEFQVNQNLGAGTGINNDQSLPDIAPLNDGRFAISYVSKLSGTDWDIFGQFVDPMGSLSGPIRFINTFAGIQSNPASTPRTDGGFTTVYEDFGPSGTFTHSNIRAVSNNTAGTASGVVQIATLFPSTTNPDIALLQDGTSRQLVVYEYAHSSSDHDIYWNVLNSNGTTLFAPTTDSAAVQVAANIFNQTTPAVAASGSTALVLYTDDVGTGLQFITGRLFSDATNTFGSSFNIAVHSSNVFSPDVAGLSGDRYVVTYTDGFDIFGKIFEPATPNGAFLTQEFRIDAQAGGNVIDPRVFGTPDGGFIATWEQFDGASLIYDIHARRFDAHGLPFGDDFTVNTSTDSLQLLPVVAVNGSNVMFAWDDFGVRASDPSPEGVRARAFTQTVFDYDSAQLGDFNNNGRADILLQNDNPASDASIGQTNTAGLISSFTPIGPVPSGYRIDGTGNFNSTADDDILLRSPTQVAVWVMNGTTPQSVAVSGGTSPSWLNYGMGDFTGDNQDDLLFRNPGTNEIATWGVANNALSTVPKVLGSTSSQFHIVAVDDFTGDGQADILFRHDNGDIAIWRVANNALAGVPAVVGSTSTAYHVVGTGDFDGNGANDILFRNDNGDLALWLLNSSGALLGAPAAIGAAGAQFHVDGTGDLNGDGRADILFRDASGNMVAWLMNGASFAAPPQAIGGAPVDYAIAAHHFDLV
jgi:FG-GAP-like repeat